MQAKVLGKGWVERAQRSTLGHRWLALTSLGEKPDALHVLHSSSSTRAARFRLCEASQSSERLRLMLLYVSIPVGQRHASPPNMRLGYEVEP